MKKIWDIGTLVYLEQGNTIGRVIKVLEPNGTKAPRSTIIELISSDTFKLNAYPESATNNHIACDGDLLREIKPVARDMKKYYFIIYSGYANPLFANPTVLNTVTDKDIALWLDEERGRYISNMLAVTLEPETVFTISTRAKANNIVVQQYLEISKESYLTFLHLKENNDNLLSF